MDSELQQDDNGAIRPGAIAAGAIMLALGGTMLLNTTGVVDVPLGRLVGPVVLMALGTLMIVGKGGVVFGVRRCGADGPRRPRQRPRGGVTSGVWLIGLGAWMMASQMHFFGLDFHNSWPLLIVLSGIIVLMRGVR